MTDRFKLSLEPLMIRFSGFCAVLGFFVSFVTAIAVGADAMGILVRPFIMAVAMAVFGTAVYYTLFFTSPKVIEEMNSIFLGGGALVGDFEDSLDDMNLGDDDMSEEFTAPEGDESLGLTADDGSVLSAGGGNANANRPAKEGEILVEGVPIQNEPKLMAEAIKHLLDQDED